MGTHIIKMPDIGEGIAQVELVEWFVKVGDVVSEDQIIADVMTDKATVEIPSAVSGIVMALGGQPGEVMAVGAELIHIQVEGAGNQIEARPPFAQASCEAIPAPSGNGPGLDGVAARPLASPAVRKQAADAGIELRQVTGTGPVGRVLHADLDAFLAQPRINSGGADPRPEREDIAVIGLRRKIAQRMQEATRNVAHFSYVEEVDVTALEQLRERLNRRYADHRGRLTLLPLIVRAMVVALRNFAQINAHYDDQAQVVTRFRDVHVGIATQSDSGLMVPVLRNAQQRDLWGNARQIAQIANAARNGKATREELSGSTITLTSLGALGGIASTPVINTPEVAIIGINRMVERPVVIDGQIVIRTMMNLSSSFDHRVIDGMDAARFIQAVRELLEQPAMLFID